MSVFNAQLIKMIEQNLYTLQRQYGGNAVLCSLVDADTDYRTGSKVVQYRTYQINKVIVLPSHMTREVVASVGRISSNKKLAYGGEFNVGDRGFIIKGNDVPVAKVKKDDWLIYRGARYSVKTVVDVAGKTGWMVVARKQPGIPLVFHVGASNAVNLTEEATV